MQDVKLIECPRDAMQGIKDWIPTGQNGIATAKNANSDVLYLFNVQKTEKGIRLNNLKGTQWKEAIDISCNSKCTLVVNQFGLAQ